jgi:hypothetical protein
MGKLCLTQLQWMGFCQAVKLPEIPSFPLSHSLQLLQLQQAIDTENNFSYCGRDKVNLTKPRLPRLG